MLEAMTGARECDSGCGCWSITGQVADTAEGTPLRATARQPVDAMRRGVVADTDIE